MELSDHIQLHEFEVDLMKRKLQKIRDHLPGEPEAVYDLCEFLYKTLPQQFNSLGFVFMYSRTINDSQGTFIGGHGNEPFPESLKGAYHILESNLPKIAETVCPKGFAEQVKYLWEKGQR